MNSELRDNRIKSFTCPYSLRLTLGLKGHLASVYILTRTVEQQDIEEGGEIGVTS